MVTGKHNSMFFDNTKIRQLKIIATTIKQIEANYSYRCPSNVAIISDRSCALVIFFRCSFICDKKKMYFKINNLLKLILHNICLF